MPVKRTSRDISFSRRCFQKCVQRYYTKGERTGEKCVPKEFKTGATFEESYFQHELAVVEKAMEIVSQYNSEKLINRTIYVNQPAIWTYLPGTAYEGQKTLTEPMIDSFEKFNSNSGWRSDDGTPWHLVMQALSHYSYHKSGGAFVLCDLQGGVFSDGVVLTDPVVLSRDSSFGPTDLGASGISTFFSNHVCNQYCRSDWTKPRDTTRYHDVKKGTTMIVPTRTSRPPVPLNW